VLHIFRNQLNFKELKRRNIGVKIVKITRKEQDKNKEITTK